MSTKNQHNVESILKRLLYALNYDTYQQLADFLGVDNKVLSAWKARNSKKAMAIISTKCSSMDLNWILSGETLTEHVVKEKNSEYMALPEPIQKAIKVFIDNPGKEWELLAVLQERIGQTKRKE
jgi:hypothetical protein